jgi:hypothetical protein
MKTLRGSTRLTILCGKWAIKIPYSKIVLGKSMAKL